MPPYQPSPWPEGQCDRVAACPLCQSILRSVLHENLTDQIFFCAPGYWTLYRCTQCDCAYLDPIPNAATIGLAYQNYYTHTGPQDSKQKTLLGALKSRLIEGYLATQYNRAYHPWAHRIVSAVLPLRHRAEYQVRHLPPQPGILADIGCGNGEFLKLATQLGWQAWGTDLDEKAVATAQQTGAYRVIQNELPHTQLPSSHFDYVTLSHVIEHVPDPLAVLQEMSRILKPGGHLWLSTPNINSHGHERYGRHWRGLEPPRHLVLFTPRNLLDALQKNGFINPRFQSEQSSHWIYQSSNQIKQDVDPYDPQQPWSLKAYIQSRWDHLKTASITTNKNEFVTLVAQRPKTT